MDDFTRNNDSGLEDSSALNMYDIDVSEDISELYATKQDAENLIKEGQIGQEFMLKQGSGQQSTYDRSWSYHRTMRIDKKEYLEWDANPTKEEQEQGLIGEELNLNDEKQNFVAVRGIILSYNWGASLEGMHKGKFIKLCETESIVEALPTKNRRTAGSFPIKQPFNRMSRSQKDPTSPSYFFSSNPHITPYAKRYDLEKFDLANKNPHKEYYKSGEVRSCLDCIKNQDYRHTFDGEKQSTECSPKGYILMAVFQLGRKDPTRHNEGQFENAIDIEWVNVADAGIMDYKGQPLDRPFIIRLDRITKSLLSSIGDGKYDIPVKLPKDFSGTRRKSYYLPNDSVMLPGDYYKWLHSKGTGDERVRMHKKGFTLYPVMTEMYSAKLKQSKYSKDYVPVFNPVPLDEDGCFQGIHIDYFVNTALLVAQQEAKAASGKQVDFSTLALPSASNGNGNGNGNGNSNGNGNGNGNGAVKEIKPTSSFKNLSEAAFSVKPKQAQEEDVDEE